MVSVSAEVSSVSVGWIGAGRLARALAVRASDAGARCAGVASRTPAHAASLAEVLAAPPLDAQGVADRADWVFVTVPDDAIAEVAAAVRWRPGQLVIHCSGAGERDLLDPARRAGAATASFHPLFLFAGLPDDAQRLAGAAIAIEADAPHDAALADLARRLGCHPLKVRPGQRALYHAGANYAASFLLCALHEAATLWQAAGIDRAEALAAMWPLVDGTLAAARSRGLAGALSGPVSRGDGGVIERHLQALDTLGADHVALYAALTRRALALAAERGHPPADVLDTLAARLPGAQ
ncbi:Rossmann-like and DUF2520 domain-containing protein [Ralstonia pseudosolanacearum]|uniref:DUF2520 domain-containing protein n=1 Tax=Ralstonia solanacearum TaxID=305 RepID=A0AA92K4X1_RALSL|nr:DUF2520 domain-containing protein [Ralstonia pseudosolanacearum]QOK93730.1 DUF2520 domain-containing protein [Ralstonia pseudosolanacearum]QOK98600.1 DUF2520 domain-containing protein [Ralstonia pseudosolanacearum]UWD88451.1 DUF2520 domain-containing protein [Ralstonia pseudosolanacearum]CAH0441525.1 hypothetical protein LMG9673_02328 [Ralstonia pseudosolanacearum]